MKDYFSNPPQPLASDFTWANRQLAKIEERFGELIPDTWLSTYWDGPVARAFRLQDHDIRFLVYPDHYFARAGGNLQKMEYTVQNNEPVGHAHQQRMIQLMIDELAYRAVTRKWAQA